MHEIFGSALAGSAAESPKSSLAVTRAHYCAFFCRALLRSTINHVTVKVKDFEKEEAFYEAALTPLGYGKGPAFPGVQAFVAEDGSAVWVSTAAEGDAVAPIHVAFQAADNAVKAFYEAGLANGGTDNGEPGPRPNYGPTYYAAFVHDPEGNNIEAMLA